MLISIGFFSKKTGLLKKEHASVLNNIIIYITMPALIFRAVSASDMPVSLLKIPLLAFTVTGLCMLIAFIAARFIHLKRPTFGALVIAAAIGNTGYLGFPLTLQLFGIENLVKAVFYDLSGTVAFTFTAGLLIADRYGEGQDRINIVREIVTFPPLIALVLAFILRGIVLPGFLINSIEFLASATVPLIMLSIGLSLELAGLSKYKLAIGMVVLIKLGLSPLLAFASAQTLGMSTTDLGITCLEASMPTAMILMVIGLRYGLDTDFIPAAIVTTTMISLITIPVWQYAIMAFT